MRKRIIATLILVVFAAAWLLSGILSQDPNETPNSLPGIKSVGRQADNARSATSVRARRSFASEQRTQLILRGRTGTKNNATVRA